MSERRDTEDDGSNGIIQRSLHAGLERLLREIDQDEIVNAVEQLKEKYPGETREELARRLLIKGAVKTATVGTAAGAIGGPMALLAMGPDIFTLVREQSRLVLSIAVLYGQRPKVDERLREVLAVLAVATGTTLARAGMRELVIRGLETELVETVVKKIAGRAIARRLPRIIPVVGGIVGGVVNIGAMVGVERAAIEYYREVEQDLRSGELIDVTPEDIGA
ncbi:MAG: EcsC family protein [Acidobacteria bacterium]|nr:EcsC family protein [Acidobacteriota bacterium]